MTVRRATLFVLLLVCTCLPAIKLPAQPAAADLTIEVGGDLLALGGVVVVYPIPTSEEDMSGDAAGSGPSLLRIDERYAEVQLRYPAGGTYVYRLRPIAGTIDAKAHGTEVLTIVGTVDGRGPQMSAGFAKAYSSGARIVRVPATAELSGPGEATRTEARWGRTQGHEAAPSADRRGARALLAVVEHGPKPFSLRCRGDQRVQVCTIVEEEWTGLTARWWRAIAEQRLDRLEDHALRRCYDQNPNNGFCEPVPESDEPTFRLRKRDP